MTNSMKMRSAESKDLKKLHGIEETLFEHGSYPYFFFRQALDAIPDLFLVAEVDGQAAGYSLGSMQAGHLDGWVLSVGVDPYHQGKGIGRALTQDLLKEFEKREAQEVFLHVSPLNAPAVALYRKLGFEEVRLERDYFGPGADRLIMRWISSNPGS